jgi:hypothetical protein
LLERPEEHLDDPPQPIDLGDTFSQEIEPIRNQSEHPVARRPTHAPAACVRFDGHANEPHRMVGECAVPGLPAEVDDLVADYAGSTIGFRQFVGMRDRGRGPV